MIEFFKIGENRYKYSLGPEIETNFGIVEFSERAGIVIQHSLDKDDEDGFWGRVFIREMFLKYKDVNNFPDKGIFAWW